MSRTLISRMICVSAAAVGLLIVRLLVQGFKRSMQARLVRMLHKMFASASILPSTGFTVDSRSLPMLYLNTDVNHFLIFFLRVI